MEKKSAKARLSSPDGMNKFGLNLRSSDVGVRSLTGDELRPMVSPSYEEVPIWNILPSYQLYESTFSKNITPTDEDMMYNPPTYEASSPASSPGIVSGAVGTDPTMNYFNSQSVRVPTNTQDLPNRWENSILAHTHQMKRLTDIKPGLDSNLKIEIVVTEGPCSKGIPSKPVDISRQEYHQGADINGYVLLENISKEKINFDMFSVVFEGKVSVMGDANDPKKPSVFFKFLNMFDYDASWSPVQLDQTAETDSDGTVLKFPLEKYFEPHVVYKKFFSFKLPDRLLDCACEAHSLTRHCELLPSIGLARDQFMQSIRKLRQRGRQTGSAEFSLTPTKSNTPKKKPIPPIVNERIKDLSFPDTAISYSIETRVVAKASNYRKKLPPMEGADEFIILEDCSGFVRIIPGNRSNEVDLENLETEARLMYRNLVDRITEKIALGNDLINNTDNGVSALTRNLSITKRRQLYTSSSSKGMKSISPLKNGETYSISLPLKRKQTITSAAKLSGLLEISTPKMNHKIKYVPPFNFVSQSHSNLSTKLSFPVDLNFIPSGDAKTDKAPEIKTVCCEIVVFTYRSKKYPVPIEIDPELVYKNVASQTDNFEHNVSQPFKKYLNDITNLTKKLGAELLGVDARLSMDIKALADLSCKYHNLKVDDVQIRSDKGLSNWKCELGSPANNGKGQYSKTINVSMDLHHSLSKEINGSNEEIHKGYLTLVPSFQSCVIGRIYFLQVTIKFQNHESASIKIPFKIQL
ncbi:hypothetical protein CLIB1444_17S00628 [[Candida] jaroonii]|uniref:Uncharacterized protein n=1 Tax=[Candida] jaroonii TaxID=467808 RepID=A0ACA9YEX8_9ASCO|nr:hypothetical protein CLIB1444_17S00628 [[Candida] jaroonii]